MSKTQEIDQADIIRGLKAVLTSLECHHSAEILKAKKEKTECRIISPEVFVTAPVQDTAHVGKEKLRSKPTCQASALLKDIRRPLTESQSTDRKKKIDRCKKTSRVIFPEMRGGILYSRCYCLHRNGLQDSCPLSQCQGQPECLVKPWAICPPGKFVRQRYPELFPKASDTSCTA